MDEFAQTRQPDDLFDDDFTPFTEPEPEPITTQPAPSEAQSPARHTKQTNSKVAAPAADVEEGTQNNAPETNLRPTTKPEIKPPQAVRGDRSATGGVIKPKLTEDELSARLAAARLNNARREEAHRLAEADEAEFQQREAQEIQKRKQEVLSRREMDREREKNRQRKLAVKSGREWDESKADQEPPPRSGGYFRGAHGGFRNSSGRGGFGDASEADGGSEYRRSNYENRGKGRGRGVRDDFRGGRGHGGRGDPARQANAESKIPTAFDFPELPKGRAGAGLEKARLTVAGVNNLVKSASGAQQSWADQVEANN